MLKEMMESNFDRTCAVLEWIVGGLVVAALCWALEPLLRIVLK